MNKKIILIGAGWWPTGNDEPAISYSSAFPEISDCGVGRDAVCSVYFIQMPNKSLGLYVKQDTISKHWVVLGDVE
jgi:hypothetical protein